MNDARLITVINILGCYAAGDFSVPVPPGKKEGHDFDRIFFLLEQLKDVAQKNSDHIRIKRIMAVIIQFAGLKFSDKIEISEALDDLDSIAAGLNTLGEELQQKIEELQANNEELKKLAVILETTADAVGTITPQGKLISWNKSAERIYGYSSNEMLGKSPDSILALSDEDEGFKNILERVKKGEQVTEFHTKRKRKDGKVIDVSITLTPVFNDQKQLLFISAISRDITVQKEAEEVLRQSEERFRLLIESVKDYAIFRLDAAGNIATWNAAAEYMTGYTDEEAIGKHISQFYTPEAIAKNEPSKDLDIAVKSGFHRSEGYKVKKNGELFYAEAVCSTLYDKNGNLTGFSKVMKDITGKKAAEDIMRDQHEQIETIIGNAPSAVVVINEKGNVIKWNAKSEEIFGWKADEVMSKPMHQFIMPDRYVKSHYGGMHHFLHTGEGPVLNKTIEISAVRKNKEEFPIELGISAVRSRGNYVFIAFINDITQRRNNEEKIKVAYEALDNSNKELEAFTYSVSHDLRAPVRAIHSYTQILTKKISENSDEDTKEVMGAIIRNTNKMAHLISDLLELSHLGQKEIVKEEINMNKVVESVMETLRADGNLNTTQFKTDHLPHAYADFSLMMQVYQNLISNAVKYSSQKADALVEIGAYIEESKNVYFVKDNGAGFDMKYYSKLFGVFQRLHSAEEFEGTGIGLTIVKRIIDKHNGKVWATGEPNKGACFYFTL